MTPTLRRYVLLIVFLIPSLAMGDERDANDREFNDEIRPLLMKVCGDCHHPDDDDDAVGFLRSSVANEIGLRREAWSSAAEQLHNRTMPPADAEQPTEAERLRLSTWIGDYLESSACTGKAYAGDPLPRRLNRDQYTHAVQDLTGLNVNVANRFPTDGSGGEGFDNNGETLFLPPILLEKYLEAAVEITDQFVVTPPVVAELNADVNTDISAKANNEADTATDKTLAAGSILVPVAESFGIAIWFPAELSRPMTLALKVDGAEIDRFTARADQPYCLWFPTLPLDRGQHTLQVVAPEWRAGDGELSLATRVIQLPRPQWQEGKYNGESNEKIRLQMVERCREFAKHHSGDSDAEFRRLWNDRFVQLSSEDFADRVAATARLLGRDRKDVSVDVSVSDDDAIDAITRFATTAWRRDATDDETARLWQLLDRGVDRGESMLQAMKLPLQSVLISPNFLFVTEQPAGEGLTRITDHELASRLSLFLWHSIPDAELSRLAAADRLHDPKVLAAQVDRMLADPRSKRFATAFAGQWLGTVAVGRTVTPDTGFFKPNYSNEVTQDLRTQVDETMHWMLRHNLPITDWIDADYVVLNRRIATHYGLDKAAKNLSDDDQTFTGVSLADFDADERERAVKRTGAVGLGAVHMLTSYSRRTSPVLRGGWVLETMFGTRVPAPPPDVPSLPGGDKESEKATVRERLQRHRDNPTCAACHDLIDPIGFALENFDVLGRWRDYETATQNEEEWEKKKSTAEPQKIDASGSLPSGETFAGVEELRTVLRSRTDDFAHHYVRQMLGYALGRSLQQEDACTISTIVRQVKQSDYQTRAMILAIVNSTPFLYRGREGK